MQMWCRTLLLALVCWPINALAQEVDFVRDIRPILSRHCFACHGPDEHAREAKLDLTTFETASALRAGAAAIVPGETDASLLWERVTSSDDPMPPVEANNPLDETQVDLLRRWIEQGASYAPHWAYEKPTRSPTPQVSRTKWPRDDIDRFILHRLESEGLEPQHDADRQTLLRRVTLDLTGLPPTLDEMDAFLDDPSADALDRVVERLLHSPHHAERLAVFWLDLVRYADTVGYHGDQEHNVSPYRDWVIWAMRENMPFDRFTIEQLAGDLIENADTDSLIASGYNRLIQTSHEGGVQLKEYAAIYAADRVRNVSGAWMGATLGCAQCHDHKYDPYTSRDYYAMSAFFADIDDLTHLKNAGNAPNSTPTKRVPEFEVLSPLDREWIAELERRRGQTTEPRHIAELDEQIAGVRPRAMLLTRATTPRETRVLPRGNWLDDSGPVVQPAVPRFLGSLETDERASRLDLARWLVTSEADGGVGELTARVFVNRIWAMMFGQGLCPSLEDFGGQGRPPTHLELLDMLALDFVESGWDIRKLIRRLVLTRTYAQSSVALPETTQRDPNNMLFARQSRWRLPAEFVRDAALSTSGLLVTRIGGPSAKPYQPAGYYQHLNFPKRTYNAHADENQWRRGVYVHWQRQYVHPMFRAFDAPTREACTASRPISNTPLAALALLNDPTFTEAARAFAERIARWDAIDDRTRIARAMRMATSRRPDAEEIGILETLLERSRTQYGAYEDDAAALVSVGLRPRETSLDPVQLAAWTQVARAILNLHETITRD